MKKIIATVLAMVMALALCATAFAATDTWTMYNTLKNNPTGTDKSTVTFTHYDATTNVDGGGTVEYWVGSDSNNYVACEKDDATATMYKNNGFFAYVKTTTNVAYTVVVTEKDKTTDKASCTVNHYLVDGYLSTDGDFYVKDAIAGVSPIVAKISGTEKLVTLYKVAKGDTSRVIYASHVLGKAVKNADKGWDEATCLVCGAKVALTSNKDVLKKNGIKIADTMSYSDAAARAVIVDNGKTGKYAFPVGTEFAGSYDYAWVISGAGASTSTGTASSPKTFDAGIALYAAMALTSVAGSAVVIGKKKEF